MKKLITIGIAALALMAGTALAGDYHTGATLNCSECHNMHYSQQHGYTPNGSGIFTPLGTAGPYAFLLRDDVNSLCLSCHNGQTFAPDVLATNTGTSQRLAGALNDASTLALGYGTQAGHTLGSTATAPGGTYADANGLECVDCHTPHGRTVTVGTARVNQYRNLNWYVNGTTAAGSISYAIGTNDLTKDVFERSNGYGGSHYDLSNVDYNEPDPTQSAYGKFCGQCHSNFHGTATATNMYNTTEAAFVRHPTAGVNIADVAGNWNTNPYRVKVMSATAAWGTQGTALGSAVTTTDATPSCMSCHRSHGTVNEFGLVFPDYIASPTLGGAGAYSGSQEIKENGSTGGTYKGLCKQCHRIG